MKALKYSILSVVLNAIVLAPVLVRAGNTWDGGGANDNWNTPANWNPDGIPGYGTATFSGSTRTTPVLDSNYNMNQVNWLNTSSTWTFGSSGGSVLSLFDNGGTQAKVENYSTNALVTINAPITFAANNGSPPNPFGEINAVNGDLSFGTGTLTVNGSSVNGIKLFGGSHVVTFNNTVSASGKWFGITTGGTGNTINIGGSFTSSDFYVMNDGTLKLNSGGSLTTSVRLGGDFGATGNQNQTKSGTFNLTATAGGQTFSGVINSVSGNTSGTLAVNSQNTSGANTLSGHIALDAALKITQAAGGTLNITQTKGGDNTTGDDIKGFTETFTPAAGGTINVSGTIYNSTGSGAVSMNGAGTLILSSVNTFTGGTSLSAGTLALGNDGAIGSGPLTIQNSVGIQSVDATPHTVTNALGTLTGSGVNLTFGATSGGTGALTFTNNFNIASASASRTFTVNNTTTFGGILSGAGGTRLTKAGLGTLALNGANTFGGGTGGFTNSAGTVALNNAQALGAAGNTFTINGGNIDNISAGPVALINYPQAWSNDFTFTGTQPLHLGSGAVTLGANRQVTVNANVLMVGGIISGTGLGLTKTGAGTLILTNANAYSGNTTVSQGRLALSGSGSINSSPNITVSSGATFDVAAVAGGSYSLAIGQTLKGNGGINGSVVVASGATVAPGTSIGTLYFTNAPGLNGTAVMELNTTNSPATNDLLVLSSGTLAYGGTLTVTNAGPALTGGETFTLFNASAYSGSFSATNLPALTAGLNWWTDNLYVDGSINVNRAPSASDKTYSRAKNVSLRIHKSDLLVGASDADSGDSVSYDALTGAGSQGASVTEDGTTIFYNPVNNNPDTLQFRLKDTRGGAVTKNITINVTNAVGVVTITNAPGGSMTISFYGIPTFDYVIQRSPDLSAWTDVITNTAGSDGLVEYTETPPYSPAFYRTRQP